MNNNSEILLEKLNLLNQYCGSVIFEIGDYYVQFAKQQYDSEIDFEAVSHYFLDILPISLNKDFSLLGFRIDEETNYFKKVNSRNFEWVVKDVQKIFEEIYKVNFEKDFSIIDNIEYPNHSKDLQYSTQQQQQISNNWIKTNPLKTLLIISGIVLMVYLIFIADNKRKVGDLKSEACIISKEFVEEQLLSPKSAEFGSCDDSKIIHLGNNRYQLTNYVDASNAFGASIRKSYFIIIKYNNGELGNMNNWTVEKIEVE